MKKRKGFTNIELPGGTFQFSWGHNSDKEIVLVLYTPMSQRVVIPVSFWKTENTSQKYRDRPSPTYQGKRKRCSCFGGFGKAEVRELWRQYVAHAVEVLEKAFPEVNWREGIYT